nr:PREDICTED: dehydrogenase/reductase SDR family member on chromosome X-like [Paralichthys olivaceus]
MWLQSVLIPLLRFYKCGVKVLLYQMFNRSFTLPVLPKQNGRVAIVTGGTRGMGLETARHLASLGMHVVIAGNEREEGAAAAMTINEEGCEGKGEICYSSHAAYSQSKLALVLFTYYLQEQLTAGGFPVTVNAVDPGMVDTALYENLYSLAQMLKKPVAKILFRTPAEGASVTIYAAAASEMEGVGGCYLYNGKKTQSSDLSFDSELQEELWKKSCELVGLQ